MELTAAHWVYLFSMIGLIVVMIRRKNIVLPAIAGTFLTVLVYTHNPAKGLTAVFNASLTAASELFSIFLIIALVTALLGALRSMGADKLMVMPFQRTMKTGTVAYFVIFGVTYVISLFFWPTPAVPLIGAILLPAAVRAGLPAMGGAIAIAIAGQGMALSSDYVMQVAPGLSAAASGGHAGTIADRALVMSIVAGVIAIGLAYVKLRREIQAPDAALLEAWENSAADEPGSGRPAGGSLDGAADRCDDDAIGGAGGAGSARRGQPVPTAPVPVPGPRSHGEHALVGPPDVSAGSIVIAVETEEDTHEIEEAVVAAELAGERPDARAKLFAVLVPACFFAIVIYMVLGKVTDVVPETTGSDAAGLVGGTAAMLLLLATIAKDGKECLEECATHVVDGLVFAFKAMGVVIPIAGFFFLGNPDLAGSIMGLPEKATVPGFLFDTINSVSAAIPHVPLLMGVALLLVGLATGLDGSGFAGLPLTGSLSGALAPHAGMSSDTLAAIGQLGAVWAGGGTLIAWSSLLAVAGVARVDVVDLVRRLFFPVIAGLVVATVVGVLIF